MAVFSASVFSSTVYDTGTAPQDNGWLGGTFNDPYEYDRKGREERERLNALKERQDEVIRLKLEAQELRRQELAVLESKDKQNQRQLKAIQRTQKEINALIAEQMALILEMQSTVEQRNKEALLVLSLAYPWMNIGGTMH